MDAQVVMERAGATGAARPIGAFESQRLAALGKDERSADARASRGLDGDVARRNSYGGTEKSPPVSAVEATRRVLASVSERSADFTGTYQQKAVRLGHRTRRF